jgi:eukaryotic-like serine/threonine-protein kinase
MEYVDGLPIDIFCNQNRLPLRRRIEILLAVLQAVDHAHRHLVVHADLKPGNILVNRDAQPRLLDFGIAALLADASSTRGEHYTALFASPEQHAGERLTLASDVYALGLIMQHVLFGLPPEPPSLANPSSTPASAAKRLSRLDKTSLNEIASLRQTKPSKLFHELHGDLAFILSKALQPLPEDRFKSAHELHDELERFLLGYPIQTRPVSPLTRMHKLVLRNKLAAGFATLLIAAILVSAVGVVARAREAARKRQMATSRLHELVRLTDSLAGELYDSLHGLQGSEKAQAALLASAHQTVHKLEAEHDNDAQLKLELAQEYGKLAHLEISITPPTAESTHQSREDTSRELAILKSLPASDPNVAALLKRAQQQSR